ncbi:hypothetical protein AWB74_01914 [Caballeronia arvi]|uniref:Uncharacterized protein n=1 Tax=Caballeronia arvi TaxID=1777135 RepID=A0A158HKU0_9BURK|nr:hypothetical protein [Caballeronia arvi]SAL44984.1 hypothetical protein AWB74_01914 [Caballeronia arvi]
MDIFYYSHNFEQNVKNGQVGLIGSNSGKIRELAERLPKRLWIFKTPKGMKGSVQLLASLLVSDEPRVAVNTDYRNVIHYDPFSPESVMFTDAGTPAHIQETSAFLQYRWHAAFSAGFKGDAGLQAIEANVVRGLEAMVANWERVQMLETVKDRQKVQPINPFAQPAR